MNCNIERQLWSIPAMAVALWAAVTVPANATLYSDSLMFRTFDQSMWSSGAQASWNYDSGFFGGTWGGGIANSSPVNFGLNGIAGGANSLITPYIAPILLVPEIPAYTTPRVPPQQITPYVAPQQITPFVAAYTTPRVPPKLITPAVPAKLITPAIPAVFSPGTPAVRSPRVCAFSICTGGFVIFPAIPSVQITPAIPAVYFPAIPAVFSPAIPGITFPAVPATYTPAILATYTPAIPSFTIPRVPAVYSPAIPALYGDTRTGGSVGVQTAGALGFSVQAGANGGGLSLTLPYRTTLNLPDSYFTGQSYRVSGSGVLESNASIDVNAVSVSAKVNGIINTTNALSGTGCFIGAGCSTSTSNVNVPTTVFAIAELDTTQPTPLKVLGLHVPVVIGEDLPITVGAQTVGHVTITTPTNQVGGSVNGNTLSLSSNQTLLQTTADFGGIAQLALGLPVDVLQPSLEIVGVATIGGTLVNLQGGINFGLSQDLSFDSVVNVTLNFDRDIFGRPAGSNDPFASTGHSITFELASGGDIMFMGAPGRLLSYTYSMDPDSLLTNKMSLSIDPLFAIKAGCYELTVLAQSLAGQCGFEQTYATTNLVDISVYETSFKVAGFNSVTLAAAVPEPETYALLLAGLGLVGFFARRGRTERG